MKGAFFSKPLEWNIETQGESWEQGSKVFGKIAVKNHGSDPVNLSICGVALAYADIKKVHAKAEGALKKDATQEFTAEEIKPGEMKEMNFELQLPSNCPVSDKKSSYFLTYGKDCSENHLQMKIEPKILYTKIVGLLDTFFRFKLKEFKSSKLGVEYKLLPPTSRDMANVESLNLSSFMESDELHMKFGFSVRKLDTASVTTKINKQSVNVDKTLGPREYSLGRDMINQDQILKALEGAIAEVKMKSVF